MECTNGTLPRRVDNKVTLIIYQIHQLITNTTQRVEHVMFTRQTWTSYIEMKFKHISFLVLSTVSPAVYPYHRYTFPCANITFFVINPDTNLEQCLAAPFPRQ